MLPAIGPDCTTLTSKRPGISVDGRSWSGCIGSLLEVLSCRSAGIDGLVRRRPQLPELRAALTEALPECRVCSVLPFWFYLGLFLALALLPRSLGASYVTWSFGGSLSRSLWGSAPACILGLRRRASAKPAAAAQVSVSLQHPKCVAGGARVLAQRRASMARELGNDLQSSLFS